MNKKNTYPNACSVLPFLFDTDYFLLVSDRCYKKNNKWKDTHCLPEQVQKAVTAVLYLGIVTSWSNEEVKVLSV